MFACFYAESALPCRTAHRITTFLLYTDVRDYVLASLFSCAHLPRSTSPDITHNPHIENSGSCLSTVSTRHHDTFQRSALHVRSCEGEGFSGLAGSAGRLLSCVELRR